MGMPCNEYIQLSVDIMRHFGIAASFFPGLAILFSSIHTTIIKNFKPSGHLYRSLSIPMSRTSRRRTSNVGLDIDTPPQTGRIGWWQPHAQRMKMIDRPSPVAETETRLDARFDIADRHFNRVWYVGGPVGGFGEGDARSNCCYYGVSAPF